MSGPKSNFHTTRLRFPVDDVAIRSWCQAQENISTSLRLLIRQDIETHGVCDVLTRPPVGWDTVADDSKPVTPPQPKVVSSKPAKKRSSVSTDEYDPDDLISRLNG